MTKTLLLILSFGFTLMQAQTVTSDWYFGPGDSFNASESFNPEMIDLPASGVDQVWVPGFIEIFYDTSGDTLENTGVVFVDPSGNPAGNIVVDYANNQGELLAVSPMNYGDKIDHMIQGTVSIGTQSQDIIVPQKLSFAGLGSVVTPTQTVDDCAYLKTEVFNPDGIASTTIHLFLKDSFRNPICQINEQLDMDTGLIERSVFVQDYEEPSSTDDNKDLDFTLLANTDGRINLISESDVDSRIQLISTNGAVVSTLDQDLEAGDNQLDYSQVGDSGTYILFVQDIQTGQFTSMKFSIIK